MPDIRLPDGSVRSFGAPGQQLRALMRKSITLITGAAGEIGHVVVGTDGGDECACGKRGCLETWLAIPRLEAKFAAASDTEPPDMVVNASGSVYFGTFDSS